MPTPLCLEVVLLQCTEESCLVLLFRFVCSTQTCETGKGAGKDRISFASALWWSTVNSFLAYLNFAQKSTLHYSSACLGHVNSSIRKIYFNSERKVTQRIRSLFPCWSDMLLVHWPLPNFLYMCMYLYLTMVVENFSLLVFLFFVFKPFLWKIEDALETWFYFLMACYVTVSGGSVVVF